MASLDAAIAAVAAEPQMDLQMEQRLDRAEDGAMDLKATVDQMRADFKTDFAAVQRDLDGLGGMIQEMVAVMGAAARSRRASRDSMGLSPVNREQTDEIPDEIPEEAEAEAEAK